MRYDRHRELFEDFDRIQKSKILVCGAGGLGSNVLQLISRIGIGEIYVYDDGILDEPDLNRQILYDTQDIGKKKVVAAREKLSKINPKIKYHFYDERITKDTVLPKVDVVVDCLDNFTSRKILDAKIQRSKTPLIHGGVEGFYGQITTILPGKTKTLNEILSGIKDSKNVKLVAPYTVSLMASIQVSEAIKVILKDYKNALLNKLLIIDLRFNSFDIIELR